MFKKTILLLTALPSLTVTSAHAATAIVVSSNGYYAVRGSEKWKVEKAIAKATELCQKNGGTDVKVLATISSHPLPGNGVLVESGRGVGAIVGVSLGCDSDEQAINVAYAMCRQKGGTNPRIITSWQYGSRHRNKTHGVTRVGKL